MYIWCTHTKYNRTHTDVCYFLFMYIICVYLLIVIFVLGVEEWVFYVLFGVDQVSIKTKFLCTIYILVSYRMRYFVNIIETYGLFFNFFADSSF